MSIMLMVCSFGVSRAQVGTLYAGERQLSSSFVNHVYQDKKGFIWVSTNDGLNRYDGYTFLTFDASDGLESKNVNCVVRDSVDNVYAGTVSGLYVKIKGRFVPVTSEDNREIKTFITCFYTMPDGRILFSTSGRGLWEITSETTARPILDNIPQAVYIRNFIVDKEGVIWLSTNNSEILAVKKVGKAYKLIARHHPVVNFTYPVLCLGHLGTVYAGSFSGGLFHYDKASRQFVMVQNTETLPVYSLYAHTDGQLYVGTNGYGLKVYDPKSGSIRQAMLSSNRIDISHTKVVSILFDRYKNIWLGLFQKGLFCQRPQGNAFGSLGGTNISQSPFGDACVMAVTREQNGSLWVACDHDGAYKLDANNNLLMHLKAPLVSGASDFPHTILFMAPDHKGKIWMGSYTNGIGWVDSQTGAYHPLQLNGRADLSVFDIRIDYKERLWLGTLGDGLICYDPATGKKTVYKTPSTGKPGLVNNYIQQMDISSDRKTLFIGTATGLSCLDIASGSWTNVLGKSSILDDELISALANDKAGLWIGTNNGMYNYIFKTKALKRYTTAEGLPNNHIAAIEIQDDTLVWASTNDGLCRLNTRSGIAESFYASDGLQGNEYCEGSSFYDRSLGMMYFGGTSGLSFFTPSNVKRRVNKMYVILSSIMISDERVRSFMKSGNYVICEEAVADATEFHFDHQDNSITFNLSTLSYSPREHISYMYRINGEEWVTLPKGNNTFTLGRLSPGDYHFQVKAVDNGNESYVREFDVIIHNPWYFTPFARFIYFLLLCAAVWWYLRMLRLRNEQKLALQEHAHAEQLNEQKIQFFVNMSHELRTPMTLIITPLMQLIKTDTDPQRRGVYEVMKRNSERILHLVNQLLDVRKIDRGLMEMQMRETDIVPFIDDVIMMFSQQAENKDILLQFSHNDQSLPVWIDRSHFDKVLINLMSNAFKYTSPGGRISLRLSHTDKEMTFVVFNSGQHIPEEHLPQIFDRFYRPHTAINQNKVGTGVGLDLTRSIVNLHHGSISVANVEGGVEFTVTIPMGSAHLKDSEIATWAEEEDINSIDAQIREAENIEFEMAETIDAEPIDTAEVIQRGQGNKPLVVIVEDDAEICQYIANELSQHCRVATFADGKEALPAILREVPQLVISDVMMPVMDGYTLCTRIKQNINTNHVPVILLTAKTRDEDKIEGLDNGADLYLTKPFNMDILRRAVANLIKSRNLMRNKYNGNEEQADRIDDVELETFDEKLLARIVAVVNENLSNSDLNIEMICNEVGISRGHLHRKMKELTNQTPHDFIRNLRMKQAARLLSRKGQSVTEVMYHCGFSSSTSFSTAFKKMYGLSPRDFMREHKMNEE